MSKKKPEELTENELLYKLLQDKVGLITPHNVFSFKEGQNSAGERIVNYSLAGKKIHPNQANTLRSEAKLIQDTLLFKVFTDTLSTLAHKDMFTEMKTLEDQHYGKAILTAVDIFQKIVESLVQMPSYTQPNLTANTTSTYNVTK